MRCYVHHDVGLVACHDGDPPGFPIDLAVGRGSDLEAIGRLAEVFLQRAAPGPVARGLGAPVRVHLLPPSAPMDPARAAALAVELGRAVPDTIGRLLGFGGGEWAATPLELLGRGPGLTPLGDDILVGLAVGASRFASPTMGGRRERGCEITEAVDTAWSRTHPIAAGLLAHAHAGRAPEVLCALVGELLVGRGDAPIPGEAIRRVAATGATSGTGWIAGLVWALDELSNK